MSRQIGGKVLLYYIVTIVLFSCSAEVLEQEINDVGIAVTFQVDSIAVKTTIGDKTADGFRPILWETGDAVRIFCSDVINCEGVATESGLESKIEAILPQTSQTYYAVYPYTAVSQKETNVLSVTLPENQDGTFAGSHFAVACTTADAMTLGFSNVCSWLHFSLDNDSITSVVLTGNSEESLVGVVSATFSETILQTVVCAEGGAKSVEIITSGSGDYYIALKPGISLSNGFSIKLIASGLILRTINATKPLFIECGKMVNLGLLSSESTGISGTIKVDGVPRKGIAVSDGYTIVTTDNNGRYTIASPNPTAMYVYYSIPSDVEIEVGSNGLPCFYQKIVSGKNKYDFNLQSSSVENSFRLLALGDIQVKRRSENNGLVRLETETVPDIKAYVASKSGDMPTYAITMGDLVHNRWDVLSDVLSQLTVSKLSVPCFQTIGNHDHEFASDGSISDFQGQRKYEALAGPVNYSFDRGQVHIVVIDNIIHGGQTETEITIALSDNVRQWLKADLNLVPKTKAVILCMHAAIEYDDNLYNELKKFASYRIICGHDHYIRNISRSGVPVNVVGSINGVDWAGTVCGAGEPNGYASFEFSGTSLNNHIYKSVNYPEEYQIRMYRPDEFKDKEFDMDFGDVQRHYCFGVYGSDKIIANIWNAKDSWQSINLIEDGVETGVLTKFTATGTRYDLWSTYYYLKVAGSNTLSYARSNDHMFYGTLSNPFATDIKIRAVDTYGNVFEQSVFTGPGPEYYPDIYRDVEKQNGASVEDVTQTDYNW